MEGMSLGKSGQQGKVMELLFMRDSNYNVLSTVQGWMRSGLRVKGQPGIGDAVVGVHYRLPDQDKELIRPSTGN